MPDPDFSCSYSLLIQGPILSSGRTGVTIFNKDLTADSIVNYDCENQLFSIIEEFQHVFHSIFIVTWENEKITESRFLKFKNCRIIKLPDVAPQLIIGNRNLPTDFNNKYKQFYALSKGIEFVDTEYVVKIRTDQYIDLKMLVEEHQAALTMNRSDKDKIYIPFINNSNFLVSDFYFVSAKKIFQSFVNSMIWGDYLEFTSIIHIEFSLKYVYLNHRHELPIPLRTYFINSFGKKNNRDKVILMNFLSTTIYRLLSSDVYRTLIWRGDKIQHIQPDLVFKDNGHLLLLDKTRFRRSNFLDYMYINIPSYLIVRFPFLKGTLIHFWINALYKKVNRLVA